MRPDRAMWAVGLALACAVFAGLVLNLTTGLTRAGWAVTLAVAVLACVGVVLAVRRRRAGTVSAATVHPHRLRLSFFSPSLTAGYLLLAATLVGGAVWLAQASAGWQHSPGFAQLWLVPAGKAASATLGVRNDYPLRQTFHLELQTGAHTVTTWNLHLAAGQAWQRTVAAPRGNRLAARLTTPGRVLEATS
jgi:hypothetical protein